MKPFLIIIAMLAISLNRALSNPQDIQEWGEINEHSILLHNSTYESHPLYDTRTSHSNLTIYVYPKEKIIHGVRITRLNQTTGTAGILDGGVGYNFIVMQFFPSAIDRTFYFWIQLFENGQEEVTTTAPVQTTTSRLPENIFLESGTITSQSRHLFNERIKKYPVSWEIAEGVMSESFERTIDGMRITSLNYTSGTATVLKGGVGYNHVTLSFVGPGYGKAYDFRVEIFENRAAIKSLSLVMIMVLNILYNILK